MSRRAVFSNSNEYQITFLFTSKHDNSVHFGNYRVPKVGESFGRGELVNWWFLKWSTPRSSLTFLVMFHGLSPILYGIPMFVVLILWVSPITMGPYGTLGDSQPLKDSRLDFGARTRICLSCERRLKNLWIISSPKKVEELQARCRNKMVYMGMDQYLLIPFLGGWTCIYQLFWCSPGVQGFDTLPYRWAWKWIKWSIPTISMEFSGKINHGRWGVPYFQTNQVFS